MLQRPDENYPWQPRRRGPNPQQHDDPNTDPPPPVDYFRAARFYCVERICAPCGVVIAWTKFANSDSSTKGLKFLKDTYPQKNTRPDYICIDKACVVLRTSLTNGSWMDWRDTSHFTVDSYHYTNHHVEDFMCRKYCNPAPLDGSAPNLVIEAETDKGVKYLKRAFNTQVSHN